MIVCMARYFVYRSCCTVEGVAGLVLYTKYVNDTLEPEFPITAAAPAAIAARKDGM